MPPPYHSSVLEQVIRVDQAIDTIAVVSCKPQRFYTVRREFRMDMPQIVRAFGQPHGHLAYDAEHDGGGFKPVFLRPVMRSADERTLAAHFVLEPA